ncbi:hypothetical protein MHUMG1_03190 [Metarhizium humberi]|uniref:Uncharacterized protein n=1 Tax=Metarhizium humberi TaxID=2596975 RepID=A0A9P8MEZ6_9HYPO|nr:hypothetical protein MHUMG1_03190 [Metarhizium humberi]
MSSIDVGLIGGGIFENSIYLSLQAIISRSLDSAQDTAGRLPGSTTVDPYSIDAGVGRTHHDLLGKDVAAAIIALPMLARL